MSTRTEIPLASHDDAASVLSSAWACPCEKEPIRAIAVSHPGVFAVVTDSHISIYGGAPSFGSPQTLTFATARLTAHAFSSSGKHLVTGDSEGYVKWWDVHSGEDSVSTLFSWTREEDRPFISVIVASPETDFIAVAAGDSVCIYGEDGQSLHSIGPLDAPIRSLQWKSPNELAVNICNAICMIHITAGCYNLRQKYKNEFQEGELATLACTSNMFAAGCTKKRLVQIWDLASENNKEISVHVKGLPTEGTEEIESLEWDTTGRYLAVRSGSDVVIWDMHRGNDQEDNSLLCFGHKQKAKITALSFQPNGPFLATGGNDGQVLVFDSMRFTLNGVVGNLIGCLVLGKLDHGEQETNAVVTALAWHPSGFILAGTSTGHVDAFEVPGAIRETPRVSSENAVDAPFLFNKPNVSRRPQTTSMKPSGWAGEPLIQPRNEENVAKGFTRRRTSGSGVLSAGGQRTPGGKPKVYMGAFRRPTAEASTYTEGGRANWTPAPIPMGRWQTPYQQLQAGHYPPAVPTSGPLSPYPEPQPANPPHTPESNGSEPGAHRIPPSVHAAPPPARRSDKISHRGHTIDPQLPQMMPGGPSAYPGPYMQYATPFPMGVMPHPYCYPYQMHPAMPVSEITPVMPGYHAQHYARAPINQANKVPPSQGTTQGKGEATRKDGSSELEEEMGSKSSEATNNGVNNNIAPIHNSEAVAYPYEMHVQQGQTLYVGNLAVSVEESILAQLFTPYGPITGVQAAMEQLDSVHMDGPFEGRKLRVSFSNRR